MTSDSQLATRALISHLAQTVHVLSDHLNSHGHPHTFHECSMELCVRASAAVLAAGQT